MIIWINGISVLRLNNYRYASWLVQKIAGKPGKNLLMVYIIQYLLSKSSDYKVDLRTYRYYPVTTSLY